MKQDLKKYRRRQIIHWLGMSLSMFSMILGLTVLAWILWVLLKNGLGSLDLSLFIHDTPGPGDEGGGLRNAMMGSLMMVGFTMFLATPIGVLAGLYLYEFGQENRMASVTRFLTDIMLSAPSIVLGLFIYAVVVAQTQQFSGWAGSLALSLIAIPMILKTTDNMLRLVPGSLREAAYSLGAPRWKVSVMISLRAVQSGLMTGILLALARVSGETAPLLFTALNNQFFNHDMSKPMANLPVVIYQFAMSPYDNWNQLAWGGALIITLFVLMMNLLARLLFRSKQV